MTKNMDKRNAKVKPQQRFEPRNCKNLILRKFNSLPKLLLQARQKLELCLPSPRDIGMHYYQPQICYSTVFIKLTCRRLL